MTKKFIKAAIVGSAGSLAGGLIAEGIEQDGINGYDLGLAVGIGAVGGVLGVRKEKERFSPTVNYPTPEYPSINSIEPTGHVVSSKDFEKINS